MSEEKHSSGKGKFILGAALGAIAGAVAGHLISKKVSEGGCDCDEEECGCDKDECRCDDDKKGEVKAKEKKSEKSSPAEKKAAK